MRRQYASSVYSQKSTTSAKSGKSFLSLTTPIWPSAAATTTNTGMDEKAAGGVWQNLKSYLPISATTTTNTKKKKNDTDSITTTRSTSSSISKLKQLFNKKKQTGGNSPRTSFEISTTTTATPPEEDDEDTSSSTTNSDRKFTRGPVGILVNSIESSAEAIAERKRRRHQRREHILKLQKHNRQLQHHHFVVKDTSEPVLESSSSDTLLTEDNNTTTVKKMVGFNVGNDSDDDEDNNNNGWGYNPRIMFVEPSPVPRFRNVAPPPPPSPPYLNILVGEQDENHAGEIHIKSDDEEPTVFTQKDLSLNKPSNQPGIEQALYDDEELNLLMESLNPPPIPKPRLYFHQPLYRGQIIKFSLQNAIPDDHIILFKFLTSNTQHNQPERYFVRPSAGKMDSTDQKDIILFLNQVPNEQMIKDKIMIRWAVVQKNSEIQKWVDTLHDKTRKKWIDMLDEEWPDQVTIRMTRIKIRFM